MQEREHKRTNAASSAHASTVFDRRAQEAEGDRGATDKRLRCTSCGAEVPEGDRSCPVCHRGVYRTCFCGRQLPAGDATCPNCGADWSQSARVARKSKSRTVRPHGVLRYAAMGAGVALVATVLVYVAVSGLAKLGPEGRGIAQTNIIERLGLALNSIGWIFGQIGSFFRAHGRAILLIVGIIAVGAVAGAALYLLRRGNRGRHFSREGRRVRRKRRQ